MQHKLNNDSTFGKCLLSLAKDIGYASTQKKAAAAPGEAVPCPKSLYPSLLSYRMAVYERHALRDLLCRKMHACDGAHRSRRGIARRPWVRYTFENPGPNRKFRSLRPVSDEIVRIRWIAVTWEVVSCIGLKGEGATPYAVLFRGQMKALLWWIGPFLLALILHPVVRLRSDDGHWRLSQSSLHLTPSRPPMR